MRSFTPGSYMLPGTYMPGSYKFLADLLFHPARESDKD